MRSGTKEHPTLLSILERHYDNICGLSLQVSIANKCVYGMCRVFACWVTNTCSILHVPDRRAHAILSGTYITCILAVLLTSGPTPQVASSAVHMSAQANKERKKRKRGEKKKEKKNLERDLNSGRQLHRQ